MLKRLANYFALPPADRESAHAAGFAAARRLRSPRPPRWIKGTFYTKSTLLLRKALYKCGFKIQLMYSVIGMTLPGPTG